MRVPVILIFLFWFNVVWGSMAPHINTLSPSIPFQPKIENARFGGVLFEGHDGKQTITDSASGTQVFSRSSWTYSLHLSEKVTERLMLGVQATPVDVFPLFPFRINFTGQFDLLKTDIFKVSAGAVLGSIIKPFSRHGVGILASYQPFDDWIFFISMQQFREKEKVYKDSNKKFSQEDNYRAEVDLIYDLNLIGLEVCKLKYISNEASFLFLLGQMNPRSVTLVDRERDSQEYYIDRGQWYGIELRITER